MNSNKSIIMGAALTGLLLAGCQTGGKNISTSDVKLTGECHGVNSCKGAGDCGGKGYSCAGKNSCKGKGWKKMSKKDCSSKGGEFKG